MRWAKRLLPMLLLAALGLGGWGWFRHAAYASHGHCAEARFETAPADDQALARWLEAQPGVEARYVHVGRVGPDERVLRVLFVHTRNPAGAPPLPDLAAACRDLGYAGPEFTFRDSTDRSIAGALRD